MIKLAEAAFCVTCVLIAATLGYLVITTNPDFKLQDIALLKVFYLALLNVMISGFILTLRGVKEDVLAGIWGDPLAKALFLVGYMISCGLVIGK